MQYFLKKNIDKTSIQAYNESTKDKEKIKTKKENKKMFENEKIAITMNIIFFLPLFIINFFCYGIDGDIRLIEEVRKDFKKMLDK